MKERIEARIATLREEHESGKRLLADLETRRGEVERTMLRISGAIQALEELIQQTGTRGQELASPPS
ncbi:MAG: hypothetical protein H6713_39175 [Myxococcales bacterium]|nr:hypothetical protein [Myxococcales bacterium]MCB9755983.1 hypothetical protein [Myxococcales bacterium]